VSAPSIFISSCSWRQLARRRPTRAARAQVMIAVLVLVLLLLLVLAMAAFASGRAGI